MVREVLFVGLFERIGAWRAEKPAPLSVSDEPGVVLAPVTGSVVALDQVGDPVFSQGILGIGFGVRPEGAVAYAPVSGIVAAEVKTRHALLIKADDGAEVLLHVGVDTVCLKGEGLRLLVHKGDRVRAGDPVIAFDRALIAARGLSDTVIVTVTNADQVPGLELACDGRVRAGSVAMRSAV